MYPWWQYRIYLLYYSPHTSYLLQPLDLIPFSVVKPKYRYQIQTLSAIDDAAPIKKERFIGSCNPAREEGLSERVIRAESSAAVLCSYNSGLVLRSSQVNGRSVIYPATSQTSDGSNSVFNTPRSSQVLYKAQLLLLQSEYLSRNTRIVLSKAGRAIAEANTRAAQFEDED